MKKTFVEWWKGLTPPERDEVAIALSRKCNTAIATVNSWGLGYRTPKARSRAIIADYLKISLNVETESNTLFPN